MSQRPALFGNKPKKGAIALLYSEFIEGTGCRTTEHNYKVYNEGFYYSKVYTCPVKGEHLTRRGRFHIMGAKDVNYLLGFNLLIEGV